MREGKLSARELTAVYLQRIAEIDKSGPTLNAVIELNPEALEIATRAFRHSARELLALSAWKAGDMGAARKWTDAIMSDRETPAGTRSRTQVLSELIAASGKG